MLVVLSLLFLCVVCVDIYLRVELRVCDVGGSTFILVREDWKRFELIPCACHRSWPGDHIETLYILYFLVDDQDGPYHSDSTASRLLSEVKHCRVELVLRWGTTLESSMFIFCFLV
ncbi:hypothetical protein THAOC_21433 [Thalassiosira oceanica]|uniref:Uncharacterized protein n=1 Tax=Thalassiosira oceanica TaxID=159749 RepID=K0SIV2_THAOC|nr:hypothetical protein THAOC_21433 [Thalassiosira oceanica]|eukprot:EJK58432.1 hypothetical protein THAOC_21433 [Thalassiosira oceanica]